MRERKSDSQPEAARVSRREFVPGAATAISAFAILPRHVLGGAGYVPPSDKLNIASVGVGGMGQNYMEGCKTENHVAIADVDHDFAAPVFKRYPSAARYKDWRVMLEKEKGIDAVIIGTPDHSHAVVAMASIQLGKHVYCAKPMTRTVYESRRIAKAAREARVATQMSVQSCASESACAVAELIRAGTIGPVREVHVWTDRPVWPQGLYRPPDTPPPPNDLDWDVWLGPAPARPYNPLYHPFNWRGWYDFGTGALGDMALHTFHVVFQALKMEHPTAVSASTTVVAEPAPPGQADPTWSRIRRVKHPETFTHSSIVTWDFPPREGLPPVRLHWYDGGLKPPRPADLEPGRSFQAEGSLYVGEKGSLLIDGAAGGSRPEGPAAGLLPVARFKDFTPPAKTLARTSGHYLEWIAAAKGGPPANCNFDFASLLNETALIGVISARTGKHLLWDAQAMRFTNDSAANDYLNPPYRSGWSMPAS